MSRLRLKDLGRWYSGGTPPRDRPEHWDGDVPWISAKDIDSTRLRPTTTFITKEAAAAHSRVVPTHSLLLIVRGMALAHGLPVVETPMPVAFNQDLRALVCAPGVVPRFVYYSLIGHRWRLNAHVDQAAHGTARVSDSIYDERIPIPEQHEQRAIANFLDRECAQIDELLLETDAASALGTEWQAAQVERALVECPDIRIKYLGFRVTQGWSPEADDRSPAGDEVGVLRLSAISMGRFDATAVKALLPGSYADAERYMLTDGDVLVVRASGSLRLLGAAAQVVDLNGARVIYPDLMYRLEPVRAAFDPDLLPHVLRTQRGRAALEGAKRGAANNKLRIEDVREARIPAPIAVEAQERARLAISRTEPVARRLSETAREFAESLSEYRDALITEAVTSQLDVARLSDAQMEQSRDALSRGGRREVLAS